MTQWWVNDGGFGISPGGAIQSGGGGTPSDTGAIQYRSPLDASRAGKLSQAEYPDGYLGNIIDRQRDKLIGAIQNRLTKESYQRGVHKGSLIDPGDYNWPENGPVGPDDGLNREAHARRSSFNDGYTINVRRFAPGGNPIEILAHEGKTTGLATPGEIGQKEEEARAAGVDPAKNPIVLQDPNAINFKKMLPKYGTLGAKG